MTTATIDHITRGTASPTTHAPIPLRRLVRVEVAGAPDGWLERVAGTRVLEPLPDGAIVELDGAASITRELMLVKVKADATTRGAVLDAVQLFRAKVVDVAPDAITIQVTGNVDKLGDVLRVLEPFGIRELVQSGMVALSRGSRSITDRNTLRPVERTA